MNSPRRPPLRRSCRAARSLKSTAADTSPRGLSPPLAVRSRGVGYNDETQMDESAKKVWMTLAQLLFVGAAALAVFGFVTVAREGEKRRTCTASCLIHPD